MWPSENPWPVVIACAVIAVVLVIAWFQQKRGWLLIAIIVPLLVAAAAVTWDNLVVTDREQVTTNVREMVGAFQRRDLETTLGYISDSARDLKLLAASAYNIVRLGPDTRLTDIQVQMLPASERAITTFRVNSTLQSAGGSSYQPTMWEAKWELEADGWKMIDIQRCDPVTGKREAIPSDWRRFLNNLYPRTP